ncbi:MAG: helix-turn-helix domain-containing protein [Planctomycetaceae bacterium]|nr:helix-turn-helix domain-containing protein [Planctomycetaceae bacterium]
MQLLKVKDVAERLCHSEQTVRNLIARGLLTCYRCPGVRISEEQLAAYLSKAEKCPNTARSDQRRKSPQSIRHLNADRLREAWKEQGVD